MKARMGMAITLLLSLELLQGVTSSIHITSLLVPMHAVYNSNQTLTCLYDTGSQNLYSVEWFHNGQPFFRYMPSVPEPKHDFNYSDINVIMEGSTANKVVLGDVDLSASGSYKCKVVGEFPEFLEAEKSATMMVVVLPDEQPNIEGDVADHYRVGDTVNLNCTAAPSIPAATLVWYINDKKAPKNFVQEYEVQKLTDGLKVSSLGLNFKLSHSHFINGELKLKCTATIATLYRMSDEHSQQDPTTSSSTKEVQNRPKEGSLVTSTDPGSGSTTGLDGLLQRLLALHVVLLISVHLLR